MQNFVALGHSVITLSQTVGIRVFYHSRDSGFEALWQLKNSKNSGTQGTQALKALYLADFTVLHLQAILGMFAKFFDCH